MVARGDSQKRIEALLEACGVLLPELVLQKHADGVHAHALGHAQFLVIERRIPGGCLEHFKLVDSV